MTKPLHTIRLTIRSLSRSRSTTSFIIAALAICIGAVAAVYAVADVVLVRGLPFEKPDRLVWISSVSRDRPDRPFSLPELMDYRSQVKSVQIGAYAIWNAILDASSGAERLQGLRMSGNALALLGVSPSAGRLLAEGDDAPGGPHVTVLGYGYWLRAFAGDRSIVGRSLTLNGERFTIVGVLPRFFPLPVRDIDLVVPLDPEADPRRHARNSVNFLRAFGRLDATASVASAGRELNVVAARLRGQFPLEYAAKIGIRVTPLQGYLASTQRPTLVILMSCVGLLVAIALVNVLNLILARAIGRQGETAVRLALGASLGRIAVHALAEGALLAGVAGVLGLSLAAVTLSYAASALAPIAPRIGEARLSSGVIEVVAGICVLAALLFSVVPVIVARAVSPPLVLRGMARSSGSSPMQSRLRASFVICEIALALVILSATAALVRSLVQLQRVELGFRPDSVFVARLSLPPKRYRTPSDLARFSTAMTIALATAPGVSGVGGSSIAPLSGVQSTVPFASSQMAARLHRDWPAADFRVVSPGYLTAIGAHLFAGRLIAPSDDAAAPPVAIVNRTLVDRYFAGMDAIGRELSIDDNDAGPRIVTIVGVVDDIREVDLDGVVRPEVFISMGQVHPDGVSLVAATQFWAVRVRREAGLPAGEFVRRLREVDPTVATAGITNLRAYIDDATAARRFSVHVLIAFASIAILLTTLGVYGITAYTVEQRRREIGVRIAMGATPQLILGLVLRRTFQLAAAGIAGGVVGAYMANGVMSRLMFGVSPSSPAILATASALLLAAAMLAGWLPGRRAAGLDVLKAIASD